MLGIFRLSVLYEFHSKRNIANDHHGTEFNVSVPFKSTTIDTVERAPVKYCGRRSAILTRDARVLSGKFTRTDRRSMNPGSVADKSGRQGRVPLEPRLDCQRIVPLPDYRNYESRKRLNYDLYIQAIRIRLSKHVRKSYHGIIDGIIDPLRS